MSAAEILDDLIQANKRYAAGDNLGDEIATQAGENARKELEDGQWPVACIVCCSDSRVPPEVVFQKGLGKLFIVRTAGNRSDDDGILGSVQYAICHLGVKLLLVLGHSSCGAMKAAIGAAKNVLPDASEGALVNYLKRCAPLAKSTVDRVGEEDAVPALVRDNVMNVVKGLKADGAISGMNPMVVGGVYDLKTGLVNIVAK